VKIPIYQADAFASELFRGNPAAVCILAEPLPDALQQSIALENQLSETAFLLPGSERGGKLSYGLRWFTPDAEVDLCGHATLAAGHIALTELAPAHRAVSFHTKSGPLAVARAADGYELELPARAGKPVDDASVAERLAAALGARPREIRSTGRDLYALLASEAEVRELHPDFRALARVGTEGVGVGAPGERVDIVSRFFAPALGVDEDPATGSAHATWIPWFAARTGRSRFTCRQLSRRGGELTGELAGERVRLAGRCVTFLRGEIEV
jgi:PhzF family phenazine biosynthesis protein